ncbi:hypothetical protein JW752_00805 [Candidatus Peregrinibacteria bacterium]|nr:hypothetical protein [Candidatus Peregrinibacteria bacterium]
METETIQPDQEPVQPKKEEGFRLFKGKEETASENPEIVYFRPSKEYYDNPQELVEEYRHFIENDLQEGQVVHVEHHHAKQMADWHRSQTPEGEKKDWLDKEVDLLKHDRDDILRILIEEIGMGALIYFGLH